MDGIESVSDRVRSYHIVQGNPEMTRFAEIVEASASGVADGIVALDDLLDGQTDRLQKVIIEVNRLENEADDLLRVLLEKLFEEGTASPIEIIKMKDFYERLEIITDRCEDVTDIFKDLIARYATPPEFD
jgi:hypothetical protein